MKFYRIIVISMILMAIVSCHPAKKVGVPSHNDKNEKTFPVKNDNTVADKSKTLTLAQPLNINRNTFVSYAKEFLGTPYKYASADPAVGFDCSGYVYFVFGHFNIKSPRSSYNYENIGIEVTTETAQIADLILFTGSDNKKIGHIGIITKTKPAIVFIHSSTTKGVIESTLTGYYLNHFVKVISVLK